MARSRKFNPKRLLAVCGTFSVALGIGYVMQYGDAVASRLGTDNPVGGPHTHAGLIETPVIPVAASVAAPAVLPTPAGPDLATVRALPRPESQAVFLKDEVAPSLVLANLADPTGADIPPVVALIPTPKPLTKTADDEVPVAATSTNIENSETGPTEVPMVVSAPCAVQLNASAAPGALAKLELSAPCHGDLPVVIHHQGMMFHGITDFSGALTVDVPALASEAYFIAAFDDGEGAVAATQIGDLALYDRAVVQWQGHEGMELHAREFGANYGDVGHRWSGAPGALDLVRDGSGFMTKLGNPAAPEPLMAEVYTFPSGMTKVSGRVTLTVETEITTRNCGREVAAQSIQISPGSETTATDLIMTMPSCDTVGEFLVLKNMFQDLTLAAR